MLRATMWIAMVLMGFCASAQTPPGGVPIPSFADYGDPEDQFGVEITADGDWAVVAGFVGEAFCVYQRNGNLWQRRQRIVPPTLGQTGPVSTSLRGNRLLIARAFGVNGDPSGRVYLYERVDSNAPFQLVTTLAPSDPEAGDRFGYGLAQSDTRVFVGASGRDQGANADQGAVYVFVASGGTWTQEAKLVMADPTVNDRFGFGLDFDGQDLLIGARQHRPSVTVPSQRGAGYVYRLSGGVWTAVQKLVPPPGETANTQLGYALRARNGRAVLVSRGNRVYAAERDGGGVWSYVVLPNPATVGGFTHGDIDGNTIAISSAPTAVAVYFHNGSGWALTSQLTRPSATDGGGASVRLAGDRLLVGSPKDDANPRAFDQGSVLAYGLSNGVATPQQRLWHGSGNVPDYLGDEVGISGDWAITTARGADTSAGIDQGAAWFIRRVGGAWSFDAQVDAPPEAGETTGGVAMRDDLAFIAYPNNQVGGIPTPIVRVLKRNASNVWLPHCDLEMPPGAADPGRMAAAASGVLVDVNQGGVRRIAAYAPPTSSCGSATLLPSNPASATGAHSGFELNGSIAVASWSDANGRINLDIFEFAGGAWTRLQSLVGTGQEGYFQGDSDGATRLAVIHAVPVSSIDRRRDVDLYQRAGPGLPFVFARTLTSPTATDGFDGTRFVKGEVFAGDPAIGPNGGLAVFDFATGTRTQNLVPSGLGVEDGQVTSLAASGSSAIIGLSRQNRAGTNHAGLVYLLESTGTRTGASWNFLPVANPPLPDRLFLDGIEAQAY